MLLMRLVGPWAKRDIEMFHIHMRTMFCDDFLGEGPFAKAYPLEDDLEMANRVKGDVEETEKDSDVGNAWAKLEATVLEQDISEQE